jgi:hypothetical protein
MSKVEVTLKRLEMTVYDKVNKVAKPANFYVQKDNDINFSVLKSLLRTTTSKYASITAHTVKMEPVINPKTKEVVKKPFYDSELKEEVETELQGLSSFATGWDPEKQEAASQDYSIGLTALHFEAKDGDKFLYPIVLVFKDKETREVSNGDLLTAIKDKIESDGITFEATLGTSEKGNSYIESV